MEGAQIFVNDQPPLAQIGVYEFHREDYYPSNVVALTNNRIVLSNAIGGIWTNQVQNFPAASRVWDALEAAITNMPPSKPDERHFVVLASDGWDDSSFATSDSVTAEALAGNVVIYCIGFGPTPDTNTLQTITAATGGQYYDSASLGSLTVAFDKVAKDLNGQYLLRWPTLKRSPAPFNPSFQITYQGQTVGPPPPTYMTNYMTNGVIITTNIMTNFVLAPYIPAQHTGSVTTGTLRLIPNPPAQPMSITLRTPYVPRYIGQISIHYRPNWPCTSSLLSTNTGEILYGWSLIDTNDGTGGRWLELFSPNPQNLSNSIPFGDLGNMVQFSFRDMLNPSNAFSFFLPDNTIYTNTGGQSFLMDTNSNAVITNYPAMPHGTPIPWLMTYFPGGTGSNFWAAAEIADPDHDGVPTWLEFQQNTNPTNSSSSFVARSVTKSPVDGRYIVTFSTAINRTYQVQSSFDFVTWDTGLDTIIGTGADMTMTDTRYLPGDHIFYRVVMY